jgi:hypothetical protein
MEPQEPQNLKPTESAKPSEQSPAANPALDLTEPIAWQAPEGVHTSHSVLWYIAFTLVVIGLMALSIFLLSSWTFAILIPVMAVALLLQLTRPPRIINYAISPKGVYVGDRLYDFSEFRAFGLLNDRGQNSAVLLPVKRFSPGLTIYFSETEGEAIVDMLGGRLPMQEIHPDSLEKFIRWLKI